MRKSEIKEVRMAVVMHPFRDTLVRYEDKSGFDNFRWLSGFGWIDRMKVMRFQVAKWQMEEMGKILRDE